MEKLYSIGEAAKVLGGLSPGTIAVWLSQGRIQRTKIGRRTMISETELNRFIETGGITLSPADQKRKLAIDEVWNRGPQHASERLLLLAIVHMMQVSGSPRFDIQIVAEMAQLNVAAALKAVQNLIAAGWVERQPNSDDPSAAGNECIFCVNTSRLEPPIGTECIDTESAVV